MKKIAFLFLTRKDHYCEDIWNIFFQGIPKNWYNIYNHYKNLPSQDFLRENCIKNVIPTQWAHISLVKATILLLKSAYQDNENYFFILVSDSCIPLLSFLELKKILLKINRPIFHYKHLTNKLSRYNKLHPFIKNKLNFANFYSQHQWMILTRPYVFHVLKNNLVNFFSLVDVPDEHYFISLFYILGKHKEILNKRVTFCNWNNTILHPKVYDKLGDKEVLYLRNQGFLFLRKISPKFKINFLLLNLVRSNFKNLNLK